MSSIQVDIVSAEGEIFSGEAAMVIAPAKMGEVGITPGHAPLLTELRPGELRVQVPDIRYQVRHQVAGVISGSRCAVSRRVRDVPMVMATPDTR